MNNDLEDTLRRVNRAPGLCSLEDILLVKEFLEGFQKVRDMYRRVYVVDPVGFTLESQLKTLEFYELNNRSEDEDEN
jgi:hypothetical protein